VVLNVYPIIIVALVNLISLYKDDKVWLLQFKLFVKYMPPTEDGDTVEGATALRLFNEHVKKLVLTVRNIDHDLKLSLGLNLLEWILNYKQMYCGCKKKSKIMSPLTNKIKFSRLLTIPRCH